MNRQPPTYTNLESLFLFQSLLSKGIDADAFKQISDNLAQNSLIRADPTFDATRLAPDALQHLFLQLFQQELLSDTAKPDGSTEAQATTSPSRKRKIGTPPLPSLRDVHDNIGKLPQLIDRIYGRYREDLSRQIREDERRYDAVHKQVQVIERNERERLAKLAAQSSTTQPLASKPGKQLVPHPTPNTISPQAQDAAASSRKVATSQPAAVAAQPSTVSPAPIRPNATIPSYLSATAPPTRSTPSPIPGRPTIPGSQPRTASPQPRPLTPRLPGSIPSPRQTASPTPDVKRSESNLHSAQPQTSTGGPITWEKPYQPVAQGSQTGTEQAPPLVPRQTSQQPANTSLPPQQPILSHQSSASKPAFTKPGVTKPQIPLVPLASHPPATGAGGPVPASRTDIRPLPPLQPGPIRNTAAAAAAAATTTPQQGRAPSLLPSSGIAAPPPAQHLQAGQLPLIQKPLSSTSASPSPGITPQGPTIPPQSRLPNQPQPSEQRPAKLPIPPILSRGPSQPATYAAQPPRPIIPEHLIRQNVGVSTPMKIDLPGPQPHTPIALGLGSLTRGFGTKWATRSTPSTPGPLVMEPESPAFEPVSPPKMPLTLPASAFKQSSKPSPSPASNPVPKQAAMKLDQVPPKPGRGSRPSRASTRGRRSSVVSGTTSARRGTSVTSNADELASEQPGPSIKDEAATPRPHEEGVDAGLEESATTKLRLATPSRAFPRLSKRKREEEETPMLPIGAPSHILWTRGFTKVSSSALDQISSHRDANMFATALRERDAPNYRQIVLQPQDITSIRSAIKHGNKAAVQAALNLEGGDPGTATVWLPISEDLSPPKGIVNSAQLESELVHMFCNAIMYNPDPDRGPGPAFMRRSQDEEADVVGYRLDENGVVKNTQGMFLEVEKLLGDLRSAEKERSVPMPAGLLGRLTGMATPADDTAEDEDELAGDGEAAVGPVKRRRVSSRV